MANSNGENPGPPVPAAAQTPINQNQHGTAAAILRQRAIRRRNQHGAAAATPQPSPPMMNLEIPLRQAWDAEREVRNELAVAEQANNDLEMDLNRARDDLLQAIKDEVQGHFTGNPLWEFEKFLGNGSYGVTVLLKDRGAMKFGQRKMQLRKPRRVCLKRSINPQASEQAFASEITGLNAVRGLAHHVQVIDSALDVSEFTSKSHQGIRDVLKSLAAPLYNPPTRIFRILGRYKGPAILLEYIENGSILALMDKIHAQHIYLPNRLLWRWFYCLVRGFVGLTWKQPKHVKGEPLVVEGIPAPERLTGHSHGDLAERNVTIDECEPERAEHRVAPTLKFIDFGMYHPTPNMPQLDHDLMNVTSILINLIHAHQMWGGIHPGDTARYKEQYETYAVTLARRPNVNDMVPFLDEDLRDLVCQVLAVEKAHRPTVPEILLRIENGMEKGPDQYPHRGFEESDAQIHARLQHLLYDA
ncbi:hypothetical protein F4808DRAFT_464270 [Astrocystis sublimbata]|nr:hypothetical protein F4808DRAFT_464270 [Astrocystis sublimbata]